MRQLRHVQSRPSALQLLENARDELDQLIGEARLGIRGHQQVNELDERCDGIGRQIRAAFRKGGR